MVKSERNCSHGISKLIVTLLTLGRLLSSLSLSAFIWMQKDMEKVASIVGEEYQLTVSGYAFIMRKDLFRSRDFRCHGFAEADIPAMDVMKSGQCGCTELNLDEVRVIPYLPLQKSCTRALVDNHDHLYVLPCYSEGG